MQTIETRYLGPTNKRGPRIKATASGNGGSVTIDIDNGRSIEENHRDAAVKLKGKLGWPGPMVAGHTKKGKVWVFLPDFDVDKA